MSKAAPLLRHAITLFIIAAMPVSVTGGEVRFEDSGVRHRVTVDGVRTRDLASALNRTDGRATLANCVRLLDSLGFFHPRYDTVSPDSVHIVSGVRAVIDTVIVAGGGSVRIDSAVTFSSPVPYDAGVIGRAGRDVVLFMARRGYPFASVSTEIEPRVQIGSEAPALQPHLVVRFMVTPERACVFADPVLMGKTVTSTAQLMQDVLFKPGETFNADRIEQTRERLLSRPYIASVDVLPPVVSKNPVGAGAPVADTAPERVGVPLVISDRSGMGLDGAVALEAGAGKSTGLTGTLDFSILNILGIGDRGALYYRGDKTGHLLELNISKVHLAGLPLLARLDYGLEIREGAFGRMQGGARLLYQLMTRWAMGVAIKGNETTDSLGVRTSMYYGGDFILKRLGEPLRRALPSTELAMVWGTGGATRPDRRYTRTHLDFSAGMQVPFLRVHAFHGRMVTNTLFTREPEVPPADAYRIGGARSVRGYGDDQWVFRSVVYGQGEYLFYFAPAGAAYLFADGGVGFFKAYSPDPRDRALLLGYGIGVRIPVVIGTAMIEWARNKDDVKNPGRIHVKVSNTLADILDW